MDTAFTKDGIFCSFNENIKPVPVAIWDSSNWSRSKQERICRFGKSISFGMSSKFGFHDRFFLDDAIRPMYNRFNKLSFVWKGRLWM